ncbi:MAG TPA: tryptophan synthase subunit alpha [Vicinamibacterales bacterium]|nr:tryptophan synthase subunit alpha [Vicinamibacterales bacterium]
MGRISARFDEIRRRRGPALVAYVTAGDPDHGASRDILMALERAGADVIEVGVPFSDPIADGPAIQRATERALAAGGNLSRTLDLIASVRGTLAAPIVVFTYVNPIFRMGSAEFVERAAAAGVDGVLLLDLPIEESAEMSDALHGRDIDQIFLVSPTTTDERLAKAAALGRGFLYAISRLGVTGARDTVASSAAPLAARLRASTTLPIAIGFGISRPEHVRAICEVADAAVVGSAIVQVIAEAAAAGRAPAPDVERFVRGLKVGAQ